MHLVVAVGGCPADQDICGAGHSGTAVNRILDDHQGQLASLAAGADCGRPQAAVLARANVQRSHGQDDPQRVTSGTRSITRQASPTAAIPAEIDRAVEFLVTRPFGAGRNDRGYRQP
jgi:hypothetical protein